ncbi:MAG: Uma2 family endonuclease [Leptolyngbyaceae cyanobacterium MAG.088]|nr:Uma2 family endonuclease [Leptolyngbyaceae cyanobacterium MAG.088]
MVASVPVTIPIRALKLSPGSHLLIENISWDQYDALLTELGEERVSPRINYCNNTLELMAPLPIHERPNRLIADIVKALLDSQDRDWEDFGSTTFRKAQAAGLEPDTCFYIKNAEYMRTCERFDPAQDPPPDLSIESDVTSRTTLETYGLLQVPEVWIYTSGTLEIYILQGDDYVLSNESLTFPSLPLGEMIPELLQQAKQIGSRKMLKQLRSDLAQS